jgi:hypothetical protein
MTPQEHEIVEEGKSLEADLKVGIPDAMPRAIAYLIRQQRTQIFSEFVTDKDCKTRRAQCPGAMKQKAQFTPSQAWAWIVSVGTVCGTLLGAIHMVIK